jgi:hypothetical protein
LFSIAARKSGLFMAIWNKAGGAALEKMVGMKTRKS